MLSENEIKTWIETLKSDKEIQNLIKELGITPQNESQLWINLLSVLNGEEIPMEEIGSKGLFYFIQTHCDLENGEKISDLYEKIKGDTEFWNKSLQDLSKFFQKKMSLTDDQVILETTKEGITDNKAITIATLKDSDAAYSFEKQWVNPWRNIDGDSYDEVRKKDEVLDILKNANKLQYTREEKKEAEEKVAKWLRLIMPQYGRRVEIEDLDRNFWVIGQTIAAISNYLFGKDAPLPKVLEGILREITELWESALYLWLTMGMISQKGSGKVRVIVLPIPPRGNENGRHYDKLTDDVDICPYEITNSYFNFKKTDYKKIQERIDYLRQQYSNEYLCVIPFARLHNYKHNYYSAEYYPAIYTCSPGEDWKYTILEEGPDGVQCPLVISPEYELKDGNGKRFSPHIYACRQDHNNAIAWAFPFSTLGQTDASERFIMYGALRVIPKVECKIEKKQVIVTSLRFDIYDAAARVMNKERLIGQYIYKQRANEVVMQLNYTSKIDKEKEEKNINILNYVPYASSKSGYYLGEVPSWKSKTAERTDKIDVFKNEAYVIKIGSFMPASKSQGTTMIHNFTMAKTSNGHYTSMYGNATASMNNGNLNSNPGLYFEPLDVKYYRYSWETYDPKYDGTSQEALKGGLCYTHPQYPLYEFDSSYFKEQNLKYDGYIAVKKFLESDVSRLTQPCYVITTVGLTPWVSGNTTVYWDNGFVAHIFLYIPTLETLAEKDGYDKNNPKYKGENYIAEYQKDSFNAQNAKIVPENGAWAADKDHKKQMDEVGIKESVSCEISITKNGKKYVGKIAACQPIGYYESFFAPFAMVKDSNGKPSTLPSDDAYLMESGSQWRQFFVENDTTQNWVQTTILNGGPNPPSGEPQDDWGIIYTASLTKDFKGKVNYYDVRWNSSNNKGENLPNNKAQVSYAPIKIDENGYEQYDEGAIKKPTGQPFENRTVKIQVNSLNTGLPMKYIDNSKEDPYKLVQDAINTNKTTQVVHSSQPLWFWAGAWYNNKTGGYISPYNKYGKFVDSTS